MMKSISRFFLVLSVAMILGSSLYLVIHAVQPLISHVRPDRAEDQRPEEFERPNSIDTEFEEAFTLRDLFGGFLSMGKDAFVFAVLTGGVLIVQKIGSKGRKSTNQEEAEIDQEYGR